MNDTATCELGAIEIAAAVGAGSLTPSDVAEACLQRIAELEPRVQAFAYLDPEDVRTQAATLTEEVRAGRLRGPLHGVPVGIKDEFWVKDQPTGMRGAGVAPEAEDSTPVARLRAAGAIIVGKTSMPVGNAVPPTRNPWNLEHTAGGSSSGSGASVGARMVAVALAEQTGGSALRPAAYCGVSAIKPTFGRISRYGCHPFSWTLDHPSIIGRSMADMALVLSVIAGEDPRDPTTLPEPAPDGHLAGLAGAPRIGVVRNFYPERTGPVILDAIETSVAKLKDAGAEIREILLPQEFGLSWQAWTLARSESATYNAKVITDPFCDMASSPTAATATHASVNLALASLVPATYYLQSLRIKRWLDRKVRDAMREVDALLMGVAPEPAPRGLENTGSASLLVPWSYLGYPAVALSSGLSAEGMPLAVQIVAARNADYHLLQVGSWCEAVLGTLPTPPL